MPPITSIFKKLKERVLASQGSCPLLQFSKFSLEIWERESAPAVLVPELAIIYGRRLFGSHVKS